MYVLRNVFLQYGANARLDLQSPNAVLIKNTGEVDVQINNFPLAPGDTFTSNLLVPQMIDDTIYNITFDPSATGKKLVAVVASFVSEEKPKDNGAKC